MVDIACVEKIESLFFGPRILGYGLIDLFEELQEKLIEKPEKNEIKNLLKKIRKKYGQILHEIRNITTSSPDLVFLKSDLLNNIAVMSYNVTILFSLPEVRTFVLSDNHLKRLFIGDGDDGLFRHAKTVLERYSHPSSSP